MVTEANLQRLSAEDDGWITALKAPQMKKLASQGELQLSLFDELDWPRSPPRTTRGSGWSSAATRWSPPTAPANATSCWRRPSVVWLRSGSGSSAARCRGRPDRPRGRSALRRYKVKKHFHVQITDTPSPTTARPSRSTPKRAGRHLRPAHQRPCHRALDRRDRALLQTARTGRARVPHPRRPELEIRPINHHHDDRVRAHVLPLHARLLPRMAPTPSMGDAALQRRNAATQPDPVAKAERSPAAKRKARKKRTAPARAATATRACSPSSPRLPATPIGSTIPTRPSTRSPSPTASKDARSNS